MQNTIAEIEQVFSLSTVHAAALMRFTAALGQQRSGQVPAAADLETGLQAIREIAAAFPAYPGGLDAASPWKLRHAVSSRDSGEVLIFQDDSAPGHGLGIFLDADRQPYFGSWLKPRVDGEFDAFYFDILGGKLRLNDGEEEQVIPLPTSLLNWSWTQAPSFLRRAVDAAQEVFKESELPTEVSAPEFVWQLVLNEQQTVALQGQLTLGRSEAADIQVDDRRASRRHAQIKVISSECQLVDLNSSNGTFVNGERIHEAVWLKDGDIITIGDTKLKLKRCDR